MRITILCILICINHLTAQFSDDFSDGDFTDNPTWSGNLDDFVVNENFQLQLNASSEGTSELMTSVTFPDSFIYEMDFALEFNPSGTNYARIYFGIDNTNTQIANGYYIQVGENGSEDALELHLLLNGKDSIINRTQNGSIATNTVDVRLRIVKKSNSSFSLETDLNNSGSFKEDFNWVNTDIDFSQNLLIGVQCTYTSSRVDKFFFDNFNLDAYTPDLTPPELLSVIAIDNGNIQLFWNEAIEKNSVNPLNISIDNGIGDAITASLTSSDPTIVEAMFDNPFNGIVEYEVKIDQIKDIAGNQIEEINFKFNFAEKPQSGDLNISEILYDPYSGGSDFVEIYNSTNRRINLEGVVIGNREKQEEKLLPFYILNPLSYVAISEDTVNLISTYNPVLHSNFLEADIPSFNNGSGNVYIDGESNDWDETFDYNDELHSKLIDDTEGVSLERLSFEFQAKDQNNWFSSAGSNLFATPGYQNSNQVSTTLNEGFELESTKFSPNNDGENDVARLLYKLDNPGKVLNLSIYDSNGFFISKIADNLILGTSGFVDWDGLNSDGNIARLGIYIIKGSCFELNGNTTNIKKVISLVDYIE